MLDQERLLAWPIPDEWSDTGWECRRTWYQLPHAGLLQQEEEILSSFEAALTVVAVGDEADAPGAMDWLVAWYGARSDPRRPA